MRWIPAVRVALMGGLSAGMLFLAWTGLGEAARLVRSGGMGLDGLGVVPGLLILGMMTLLGVMLYSLATKRLRGLAYVIGAMVSLALLAAALSLPGKLGVYSAVETMTETPEPAKIAAAFGITIFFFALPFWVFSRALRLTETWLYPKVFQPLEAKI